MAKKIDFQTETERHANKKKIMELQHNNNIQLLQSTFQLLCINDNC